jgi:Tol biopolymer transport system component
VGGPRFAPSGSMVAYATDTLSRNHFHPKIWMRDVSNFAFPPIPVMPTTTGVSSTEVGNAYWNPSWRGAGDSLVVESYDAFSQNNQVSRGLYKFSASGNPPTNPEPFVPWLGDITALEPDWSPDGQHIVFSRRSPGHTDRDLWIINAGASDISEARRVTFGPADEFHPRFSSDGSTIFFVSNRVDGYGENGVYDTERRGMNIWSVSRFDLP